MLLPPWVSPLVSLAIGPSASTGAQWGTQSWAAHPHMAHGEQYSTHTDTNAFKQSPIMSHIRSQQRQRAGNTTKSAANTMYLKGER